MQFFFITDFHTILLLTIFSLVSFLSLDFSLLPVSFALIRKIVKIYIHFFFNFYEIMKIAIMEIYEEHSQMKFYNRYDIFECSIRE